MNICECGCGRVVKAGNRFIKGHARKGKIYKRKIRRPCKCGCGGITKPGNKFIHGHNTKGIEWTKETLQKRSKAMKLKHQEPGYTESIAEANRGQIRSLETRKKLSKILTGRKLSKEHILNRTLSQMKCRIDGYCNAWGDEEYKDDLRKDTCSDCGMTEKESLEKWGRRLSLHHKDGNKKNCHPNNFDTLCVSCHAIADAELRKPSYNYKEDYIFKNQNLTV